MTHTLVQLHFVRGLINHRLRFGQADVITKLDKYRSIAAMPAGSIFGYIRWRANEYGTIDWRVYVLKAQGNGYISDIAGVRPAVKILLSALGKPAAQRCLKALDKLEKQSGGSLETVAESYWPIFNNALLLRKPPRDLPRNHQINEAIYAR